MFLNTIKLRLRHHPAQLMRKTTIKCAIIEFERGVETQDQSGLSGS